MGVADGGACGGGGGGGGSCLPFSPKTQFSKPNNAVQEAVSVKKEQKAVTCKGGGCDRSSSSSSSTASLSNKVLDLGKPEEEAPSKVVHFKEESIEVFGDDVEYGRDYSSSSSMVVPKPMECLLESGPPPFLKKTFQMVDDTDTDPIVSWSESRESFIVWDSHEFSKTLLPKYFKHSNFSSFIRQLNTYGFKKVDPDRWEFANEGFQGGKKHLLKNIKRRSRYNKQPQGTMVSADSTKEDELETLKKDQDLLKLEIMNLRQQRKNSQHQLTTVEERIRNSECKQQTMLFFLIKIAKNPTFVQQLMQKRVLKRELDGGDLGKRRRLLSAQGLGSFTEEINRSHSVNSGNQLQEQLVPPVLAEQLPKAMATQKKETPLSAPMVDKSCNSVQNQRHQTETSTEAMPSVYHNMSEKLLGENSIFDEEFAVNDSNLYQELEDLIAKPRDWSGYVSNCLVEQAGCIGSMP